MSTKTETKHTPTPWDPYPKTSVLFVQLSLDDYRHAVHCVNAHDDLLAMMNALIAEVRRLRALEKKPPSEN